MKDALPTRISEELHFSREDLSTFEGLKRAVMRIDSDYWRHVQDGKNKTRLARSLQDHIPRPFQAEPSKPQPSERSNTPERPNRDKPRAPFPSSTPPVPLPLPSSILGPDGRLTPLERQHRLDLGLCMRCRLSGYLARNCPRQSTRNRLTMEA